MTTLDEALTRLREEFRLSPRAIRRLLASAMFEGSLGHPRYFCRTHGEPLRYHLLTDAWRCPDHATCGTWIGAEHAGAPLDVWAVWDTP